MRECTAEEESMGPTAITESPEQWSLTNSACHLDNTK